MLALAGPFITSSVIARMGPRSNRDVVLVFDGSYSMGSTGKEGVPHEKAKEWAKAFVADLTPGDTVAILQAKEQVVPVLAEPSHDLDRVKEYIGKLPAPSGGCDWRPALQAAAEHPGAQPTGGARNHPSERWPALRLGGSRQSISLVAAGERVGT